MNQKLNEERLSRRAVVYIRQSSMGQVHNNKESQFRQYGLEQKAKDLGFRKVSVIDDDLGRSGSGKVERPGFQRLVAEVCSGDVGAVFCIEASRLARNGRDWHYLIEMCGLVGTVVIDPDGIYDPCVVNDRLLLGLKGTMSEFELNLLRQRSEEAIKQKARRGELRIGLPVGYVWTRHGKVEKIPDLRVQQGIELVFAKMVELGSARQVLLWFRQEKVVLPNHADKDADTSLRWRLPIYNTIHRMLTNPVYAGAYAFGKTYSRTTLVSGRAHKTAGHKKPRSQWTALIRGHHEGYITWEAFERNQAQIEKNAHMKSRMMPKSGRGGKALLSGLLRCKRCGRMFHVTYSGIGGKVIRYQCRGANVNHGKEKCLSFGGVRVDREIANEVLRVIGGNALEAALQAATRQKEMRAKERKSVELDLEQAQYESQLAARRYEAVDPHNRLVASELEARWNHALQKANDLEQRLKAFDHDDRDAKIPDQALLLDLADDLPRIWHAEATDMRLKQRITRILIQEVVADVDEEKQEIVLLLHWAGHRHSTLKVKKNKTGRHTRCTSKEAVEIVKAMSGRFTDEQIAATLNRLNLRTGAGNTWNEKRVYSLRHHHKLPAYKGDNGGFLTLQQTATRLGVSASTIRRLIKLSIIKGEQVVPCAPWKIPITATEDSQVVKSVQRTKEGKNIPRSPSNNDQIPLFSSS